MDSNGKIIPNENDVLLGRGGKNNRHVGNERLRSLAKTYVDAYTRSTKKGKSNISWDLVQAVRSMNPPGRFLKRDSAAENWIDVGDECAREKTSQAMRDAIAASNHNHVFGPSRYAKDAQSASRTQNGPHAFPVSESSSAHPHPWAPWLSHAHAHPHMMYSSPRNIRPRSLTTDSVVVSPEHTGASVPGNQGSFHNPRRSVSFSEYAPVVEASSYPSHPRWAHSPERHYPHNRHDEDKTMDLDMRPLNSWDHDEDVDDVLPALNGIDYTSSTSFPDAPHPWNNPHMSS